MADVNSVYTNKQESERALGSFRRLNCSSFQAMLNHTAINDSKGESFSLDFNLKDVNYAIEVEISPGKCTYLKSLLKYRSADS